MFFSEPAPTRYDFHFQLFGIPVRIHPFFWLTTVLLGANTSNAVGLLVWILAVTLSILVHELGHAAAMRAYGLSPWITLTGLGGLTAYNRSQPFGVRIFSPLTQILISAAGPLAGFALVAVGVGIVRLTGHWVAVELLGGFLPVLVFEPYQSQFLTLFCFELFWVSFFWGLVNLLPVYPLDGGQIAREVLVHINPQQGIRRWLMLSVATGGGMAVIGLAVFGSILMAMFFGYMAFTSYVMLKAHLSQRPW